MRAQNTTRALLWTGITAFLLVQGCVDSRSAGPPTNPSAQPATATPADPPVGTVHFMTVSGAGQRVVFVCDASASMMPKFDWLRRELRHSIDRLGSAQSFNILC